MVSARRTSCPPAKRHTRIISPTCCTSTPVSPAFAGARPWLFGFGPSYRSMQEGQGGGAQAYWVFRASTVFSGTAGIRLRPRVTTGAEATRTVGAETPMEGTRHLLRECRTEGINHQDDRSAGVSRRVAPVTLICARCSGARSPERLKLEGAALGCGGKQSGLVASQDDGAVHLISSTWKRRGCASCLCSTATPGKPPCPSTS